MVWYSSPLHVQAKNLVREQHEIPVQVGIAQQDECMRLQNRMK